MASRGQKRLTARECRRIIAGANHRVASARTQAVEDFVLGRFLFVLDDFSSLGYDS